MKSSSAFATHSRVRGFIHHAARFHYFAQEGIALRDAPREVLRIANDDIHREVRRNPLAYGEGWTAPQAAARFHNDEHIHIRIPVRPAASMGTEQDDALRVEFAGDGSAVAADGGHGNHGLQ